MDAELIWETFEITSKLTKETILGQSLSDDEIAGLLVDLVHKGMAAHEEHTGEPMFPDLIKEEEPL